MLRSMVHRGWTIVKATGGGWRNDDGALLSAATAYYAAFSLLPLCLVLIAGLGFVGRYSTFVQTEQHNLIEHVAKNVSPWLADELQRILTGVQAQAMLGGPLGLLALIFVAIGIFTQLENIFDRVWGTPEPGDTGWLAAVRAALWDRLLAFLTLLAIGALLIAVFLTDFILAGVRPYLTQLPAGRSAWHTVQLLTAIGCDAVLLGVIYRVLPKASVRWRDALAGGLLAAVVWAIGRHFLLSLVVGEKYSVYGVVGSLMGVMLWFYYASAVVFLGAEFAHALDLPPKSPPRE
jgi:membrane protein